MYIEQSADVIPVVVRSTAMVSHALHIVRNKLARRYAKRARKLRISPASLEMAQIIRIEKLSRRTDDIRGEALADFKVKVCLGDLIRDCRLRVEPLYDMDKNNKTVEDKYNRQNLSLIVIVVRLGEAMARVVNRVYKAICLLANVMRREKDDWRKGGNGNDPVSETFHGTWKRNRDFNYRRRSEKLKIDLELCAC